MPAESTYPVAASPGLLDWGSRVLKHGDTFLVAERHGDIVAMLGSQLGLYHRGTRHLSELSLTIGGTRLLLLGSAVSDDNILLVVELMNPDVRGETTQLEHGTVHVRRERLIWQGALHERIRLTNYASETVSFTLCVGYAADFVDLFEVRGTRREGRGALAAAELRDRSVRLAYRGLDTVERETLIAFDRAQTELTEQKARFHFRIEPGRTEQLTLRVSCERGSAALGFDEALAQARARLHDQVHDDCVIETSNELFNEWIRRSQSDLRMMVTETEQGRYPYAGVPWFSTPFGRDALITALEALWVNPALAAGVLDFLAARQAERLDAAADAEPGKILHELRHGEMAALGEVPFARYYGSIDATPLFVVLAGRYFRATGDLERIQALWPRIRNALAWIDEYGDRDGDGFVEYGRRTEHGLSQQGWKDSHDAVFHADGSPAAPPIALCEVQAYVYAARLSAAELADALGEHDFAHAQRIGAAELRDAFEQAYWSEALGTYVLALDGEKRRCEVRASNAGHALLCGIASPERAQRVAAQLLGPEMFSGWGIRTLAVSEARYSPMAYHNGSVWPHDNALIAQGLSRYGLQAHALQVLEGLFAVSQRVELHRLPELFCGFERKGGEGPTLYPVACAPQAWAAASVFMLLGAVLGLQVDATERCIRFVQPVLPPWLERVTLRNLRVGDARVDLAFHRYPEDVAITVLRRTAPVEVVVAK